MKKQGQIFIQDTLVAIGIMVVVLFVFMNYLTKANNLEDAEFNRIMFESKTISDYLVGQGYPFDWNESNVIKLGLTNGKNVIMNNKIQSFKSLTESSSGYENSKVYLKTKYDYIIFFKDTGGNIVNLTNSTFMGMSGVNSSNIESINPVHLTTISRFLVEKKGIVNVTSNIYEMVIYVWE